MVRVILLTLSLGVVLTTGCSSHRSCAGGQAWTITVGSGGGVTGGSSGYQMDCEGKLSSWQKMQAGATTVETKLLELGCDSAAFYKTYLDLIRFDTISYAKVGNWTYFVEELRGGEYIHRVSWTGEDGPAHVRNFYDLFIGSVTSRVKK
jgi:hypothetical protein